MLECKPRTDRHMAFIQGAQSTSRNRQPRQKQQCIPCFVNVLKEAIGSECREDCAVRAGRGRSGETYRSYVVVSKVCVYEAEKGMENSGQMQSPKGIFLESVTPVYLLFFPIF